MKEIIIWIAGECSRTQNTDAKGSNSEMKSVKGRSINYPSDLVGMKSHMEKVR